MTTGTALAGAINDYGSVPPYHQREYIKFEIVSGQEPNIKER